MQKCFQNLTKFFVISLFLSSCQKEEAPDVRDSLIGTYSGIVKAYQEDVDENLVYLGSQYDFTQNLRCEKDIGEGEIVFFKEDNSVVFKGNGVTRTDNGTVFNVLEKTVSSGTTYFPYDAVEVGSKKYSGVYDFASRKILFYQYWIEQGDKYVFIYEGTK